MFRSSLSLLGRWNSMDFLKGRGRKGGQIHTRHTLGSNGRASRYFIKHAYRDGRSDKSNRTRGELGVRLFGGTHGPRQTLDDLAFVKPESYELGIYGNSEILHPFRGMLSVHPDLDSLVVGPVGHAILALPIGMGLKNNSGHDWKIEKEYVVEVATNFLMEMFVNNNNNDNLSVMPNANNDESSDVIANNNNHATQTTGDVAKTDGNDDDDGDFVPTDTINVWSEKSILIGTRNNSVMLKGSDVYKKFLKKMEKENNKLKKNQKEGAVVVESFSDESKIEPDADENTSSIIDIDQLGTFVQNMISELVNELTMSRTARMQAQVNEKAANASSSSTSTSTSVSSSKKKPYPLSRIKFGTSFLTSVIDKSASTSLRCIVDDEKSLVSIVEMRKKRQTKSNIINLLGASSTTSSFADDEYEGEAASASSGAASPNEIIKWFMRTHDPRSHFGSANHGAAGHHRHQFSCLVVQPYQAVNASVFSALRKHGVLPVSKGVTGEELLTTVADVVLDDTAKRVGIFDNNDDRLVRNKTITNRTKKENEDPYDDGVDYTTVADSSQSLASNLKSFDALSSFNSKNELPASMIKLAKGSSNPWTANDNDGSSDHTIPFPHLMKKPTWTSDKDMVGAQRNRDGWMEKSRDNLPKNPREYAKSYFSGSGV